MMWNRVRVSGLCLPLIPAGVAAGQTGYLFRQAMVPAGGGPSAMAMADFDRDGRLDVATANLSGDDMSIGGDPALHVEGVVRELYDVVTLKGVVRPKLLGFKTDEIQRMVKVGEGV